MIYLYTVFWLIGVVIDWLKAGFLWPLNRSGKSPYNPSENESQIHKPDWIGVARTRAFPFPSDSAYDPSLKALESSRYFATPPVLSPRNDRRNSIPETRQYPDLRRASDWMKKISDQQEALLRSGLKASSLWNFCARFSDFISRGNQSEISAGFSAKTTEIVGVALSRRYENET